MRFKCIYSDLMFFSEGAIYEGEYVGCEGYNIEGYYAEMGWDSSITIDGYDTAFMVVE